MAKQSGFLKALQAEKEKREAEIRFHTRVFELDMVTIALGRMGFREAKFAEFNDVLFAVEAEYSKDILDDAKSDKDLWYSKDSMDREIAQYVGSLFVPYDERHK